jgi:hypothetical protein
MWQCNPEDRTLHSHPCENLKPETENFPERDEKTALEAYKFMKKRINNIIIMNLCILKL